MWKETYGKEMETELVLLFSLHLRTQRMSTLILKILSIRRTLFGSGNVWLVGNICSLSWDLQPMAAHISPTAVTKHSYFWLLRRCNFSCLMWASQLYFFNLQIILLECILYGLIGRPVRCFSQSQTQLLTYLEMLDLLVWFPSVSSTTLMGPNEVTSIPYWIYMV